MNKKTKRIRRAVLASVILVAAFLLYPKKLSFFFTEPASAATECTIRRQSFDGLDERELQGDDLTAFLSGTEHVRLLVCGFYGLTGTYTITLREPGKNTFRVYIDARSASALNSVGDFEFDDQGYAYIGHLKFKVINCGDFNWVNFLQSYF